MPAAKKPSPTRCRSSAPDDPSYRYECAEFSDASRPLQCDTGAVRERTQTAVTAFSLLHETNVRKALKKPRPRRG
jgi:hypothetical protein